MSNSTPSSPLFMSLPPPSFKLSPKTRTRIATFPPGYATSKRTTDEQLTIFAEKMISEYDKIKK